MQNKPVVIIGGGLAGLYCAYKLQQLNKPYLLLESKADLGGRILAAKSPTNSMASFDLGPTWMFPHQPNIQQLITSLELSVFEQFTQGDVLYQAANTIKPRQIAGAGEIQLFRLTHGMVTLIDALYKRLDVNSVLLEHTVTELKKYQGSWQITAHHNDKIKTFNCEHVVAALPPRMITSHLTPENWADHALIKQLNSVPTWMAGQAKFIATFERAFWRDKNLSGQCFSQVGPMVEVHDASASNIGAPALFGFIGLPYSERRKVTTEQLKQACIEQLAYFYGNDAYNATGYFIKDWAADPFVANVDDKMGQSHHPAFNFTAINPQFDRLNIHFVGSEFAKKAAGYLEGALNAVDEAINNVGNE
jgi:monoamine oxidase